MIECCSYRVILLGSVCLSSIFFFSSRRRHTRCLSDWSSDVCSSDLAALRPLARVPVRDHQEAAPALDRLRAAVVPPRRHQRPLAARARRDHLGRVRSEERRVGKEGRAGWWRYAKKKKQSSKSYEMRN